MAFVESGYVSLNKHGEQLCGDRVEIINHNEYVTTVLSDGLGSGVKASILATLTSKIIGTMIANGLQVDDAVETIAHTLPVCKERQIAYSTFSISKISENGDAYLIQYDNPNAILINNGKCVDYPKIQLNVYGKKIYESRFKLEIGDMLLLISDGVVHAGVGSVFNLGWRRQNVCEFVEEKYNPSMTSKTMAATLAAACRQLYVNMPGDDTTVAVQRLRALESVNVMVGPPVNRNEDDVVISKFLSGRGKKIVCGGTTSQIVASHLKTELKPKLQYFDKRVPPTAEIKGIDLVTEGVLTLSRAVEIIGEYNNSGDQFFDSLYGKDGASQLAKMLLEDSTNIHIFVGRAINPAHQNPEFPSELSLKTRLIKQLASSLETVGKKVDIEYS